MLPGHVYEQRVKKIREQLEERGLSAIVLSKDSSIIYTSGFSYAPGDRVLHLVLPLHGEPTLLVPELEFLHAKQKSPVKDVRSWGFFDFPTRTPYLDLLGEVLHEKGLDDKKLGIEERGNGKLAASIGRMAPNAKLVATNDIVAQMMLVKSSEEIELLKKICRYLDLLLYAVKAHAHVGEDELRIGIAAVHDIYEKIIREIPEAESGRSAPLVWGSMRTGPETACPHGFGPHNTLKIGEIGYLIAIGNMFDYTCISTRSTSVGRPPSQHLSIQKAIVEALEEEKNAMRPGVKCSDISRIAKEAIEKRGFRESLRGGYTVGLLGTGGPMLADGDETELKAGMTFYVVRGVFDPSIGGPRCSDTVVVTEKGAESLTNTPRDLDAWIIE